MSMRRARACAGVEDTKVLFIGHHEAVWRRSCCSELKGWAGCYSVGIL